MKKFSILMLFFLALYMNISFAKDEAAKEERNVPPPANPLTVEQISPIASLPPPSAKPVTPNTPPLESTVIAPPEQD